MVTCFLKATLHVEWCLMACPADTSPRLWRSTTQSRQRRWPGHFSTLNTHSTSKRRERCDFLSVAQHELGSNCSCHAAENHSTPSRRELPPDRLLPCTPPTISLAAKRSGTSLESDPRTAEFSAISRLSMQSCRVAVPLPTSKPTGCR